MSLEKIECINPDILKSLSKAKILAGARYDLKNASCDQSCFCDTCNCVCNQPCHGEGPCYTL